MKNTRLGLQRFQMKLHLTRSTGVVHYSAEICQENLMRINYRVLDADLKKSPPQSMAWFGLKTNLKKDLL